MRTPLSRLLSSGQSHTPEPPVKHALGMCVARRANSSSERRECEEASDASADAERARVTKVRANMAEVGVRACVG
jgi:hypothetical protein